MPVHKLPRSALILQLQTSEIITQVCKGNWQEPPEFRHVKEEDKETERSKTGKPRKDR